MMVNILTLSNRWKVRRRDSCAGCSKFCVDAIGFRVLAERAQCGGKSVRGVEGVGVFVAEHSASRRQGLLKQIASFREATEIIECFCEAVGATERRRVRAERLAPRGNYVYTFQLPRHAGQGHPAR